MSIPLVDQPVIGDQEEQPPVQPAIAATTRYFKLPDFWPSSPHAWFGIIESQFELRNVLSQRDRFGLVASVLPETSARKLTHLLSSPPENCYDALKAAILDTHQLTEMQKMDLLFNMDELGSKRPMDLLSEMLELVRPGEEKTSLFAMLFLRRLPCQVRAQLTEDSHDDLHALAQKADRVAAFLARQAGSQQSVHAVHVEPGEELQELTVSAVGGKFRNKFRPNKQKSQFLNRQQQQPPVQQPAAGGQAQVFDAPSDMARLSTGLCHFHFTYGSRARSCRAPCSWQGN